LAFPFTSLFRSPLVSGLRGRVVAGLEDGAGQRGRRQAAQPLRVVTDVAVDRTEALGPGLPLLAVARDLVMAAADEVPPHDDLLAERRASQEDRTRRAGAGVAHRQRALADSRVRHFRGRTLTEQRGERLNR